MLVICFVMSMVLLCNYCVTLCYSATKMNFAQYCICGKRKEFLVWKSLQSQRGSGRKGEREEGSVGYKGKHLSLCRTGTAISEPLSGAHHLTNVVSLKYLRYFPGGNYFMYFQDAVGLPQKTVPIIMHPLHISACICMHVCTG